MPVAATEARPAATTSTGPPLRRRCAPQDMMARSPSSRSPLTSKSSRAQRPSGGASSRLAMKSPSTGSNFCGACLRRFQAVRATPGALRPPRVLFDSCAVKIFSFAWLALFAGSAAIFAGPEKSVSFTKVQLSDQFWAEGANFGDFNHDGFQDIVCGPFWFEGPNFTVKHQYRPQNASFAKQNADGSTETIPGFEGALGSKNAYSDDFLTFVYDFNADGWPDILVIDFPGKAAAWYENPRNAAGDWPRHEGANSVDNESPAWLDIDGDGKPELVCNAHGYFGYYAVNWTDPAATWIFHAISPKGDWGRFTHGIGLGDVNGDGRMDLLEKNGWWEQPASLSGDPVWKFHPFPFAPGLGTAGAAQMFAYD